MAFAGFVANLSDPPSDLGSDPVCHYLYSFADAASRGLQTLEELVRSTTAGVPFKVVLAVPEIESWLFVVPEALERVSGKKLSPDQRDLGELRPKEVLAQIFKDQGPFSVAKLADELTETELQTLRETSPRRELIEFLMEQVNKKTEPQWA